MGRLFAFLLAYANLFVFLLLQTIAISVLINFNAKHTALFQGVAMQVTGSVENVFADYGAYFALRPQNEKLQQENLGLREQVTDLERRLNAYRKRVPYSAAFTTLPDSMLPLSRFRFIPCRAVGNSTGGNYNYITLNVGSRQGVKKEMGLVSPQGVAGMVVAVSENYSVAMSLLNRDIKLSARVKSKPAAPQTEGIALRAEQDIFGTFLWTGSSTLYGKLSYVSLHLSIQPGDTVVTSAYSTIFPENIVLGTVSSVANEREGGFHDIRVKLATDFHSLDYLYLVQNYYKPEIDSLTANYRVK